MSGLRSIEMQVALPRSQTAGKIQEQMQQRSLVMQEQMAQSEVRERVRQRNTVTESDAAEKNKLDKDRESKSQQDASVEEGQEAPNIIYDEIELVKHPYKGIRFDASW
ncbi:hypothetical protein [Salipaludibacillus daqingensis]|uniref:hypothetical protein n=1 Tax=Salipaludibacillus daqingensis TaxID=3041001 RepID=UPI002474468B|nr:hypothetical protein [Salipaludibacillus daqingensis]